MAARTNNQAMKLTIVLQIYVNSLIMQNDIIIHWQKFIKSYALLHNNHTILKKLDINKY